MRTPPIDVLASWKFEYVDVPRGGRYVVITTAVLLTLTYLVVALRLWARFRLAKSAGVDDALIIFGMVIRFPRHYDCATLMHRQVPLTAMAVTVCLCKKSISPKDDFFLYDEQPSPPSGWIGMCGTQKLTSWSTLERYGLQPN